MISIALCNQKGGVGKSTTTFHLARAADRAGLRVLVVDMDPQGNLTSSLTPEPLSDDTPGVADALSAHTTETLESVLVPTVWPNVILAPTVGEALAVVRDELVVTNVAREGRLKDGLSNISDVDLVLIDCPPSLDQLTINALVAAQRVLIVSQSKQWSANGLAHLLGTISAVRAHYNPSLSIAGIIVNLHDGRTLAGAHWLGELKVAADSYGISLLGSHGHDVEGAAAPGPVPRRVVISDAVEASMGLDEYPGDNAELLGFYDSYLKEVMA